MNELGNKRHGFTLVELLVVIGIIAILISLLLPSLSRARESAKIVTCASNERTIMQMMQLYAAQSNGYLPPFSMGSGGATHPANDFTSSDGQAHDITTLGWDYILLSTLYHLDMNSYFMDLDTGQGGRMNSISAVWACPSDNFPRLNTGNFPIRSYGANWSKWGYGLQDSETSPYQVGVRGGAPYPFFMPWSGGCSGGVFFNPDTSADDPKLASGQTAFAGLVKPAQLSKVPYWIWIIGENWGQSTVYSTSATPGLNAGGGANFSQAVIGNWAFGELDTSPARFHSTAWGSKTNARNNGGNYAYADGHVEFIRLQDLKIDSPAWNPFSTGTKSVNIFNNFTGYSVYDDHWKWHKL
jgi:prepilin-type N-terminal cleavage/methylation domain-containing protein/prepilin-type processing-associated H-X9-DG protein